MGAELFDLDGARRDRDAGQARALAAKEAWRDAAWRELVDLACKGAPFTSETVVSAVGLPSGEVGVNANNAVGALMAAASRCGLIVKTGRHVQARRRASHAADIAEWVGAL